jgi:hypothetical protein
MPATNYVHVMIAGVDDKIKVAGVGNKTTNINRNDLQLHVDKAKNAKNGKIDEKKVEKDNKEKDKEVFLLLYTAQ